MGIKYTKYYTLTAVLFLIIFLGANRSFSQQDPQFSQYMFNPLFINPAYAGSRDALSSVLLHRSQWVGFDGAPQTQTFSIHAPAWQKKLGLGLSVINDKIGPTSNFGALASYAYRVKIGDGKLSFALRTGIYNYRFDWNSIEYKDKYDVYSQLGTNSFWVPSFDFGSMYYTRSFYAGITFSHLNQPNIGQLQDTAQFNTVLKAHMIFTVGNAFQINRNVTFKPSIFYKTTQGTIGNADFNFSFLFNQDMWVGVTYRTNKNLVFITEYNFTNNLRAGYSFDFALSKLRTVNSGTHELFIGFDLPVKKSKVLSPRYF
jgi:type IX secretion system PorP/SprF family membrane protein